MHHTKFALGFALLASLTGRPAAAQIAGVYAGTAADGSTVSFTVTGDANSGYALTSGSVLLQNAQCNGGGPTLTQGEGFGMNAPSPATRWPQSSAFPTSM